MNPPTSIAAQAVAKHADPAVAAAVLQEVLSQLADARQDSWPSLFLYRMALTALIADLYGTPLPSESVLAEVYPALQPAAPTTTKQP
jgi:hypothetical protein